MLAALSATNEAIMRAKSREELYDLVCQASATGGKFTSATIALASPGSEFLEHRGGGGSLGRCQAERAAIDQRQVPGGPRDEWYGIPYPAALHQQ